jgi:hypothetical protein
VPKVINGGGIEQMFVRVEGRACPNNERGNKKPNPIKYRLDPEGLFSHNNRAKDNGKIDTDCKTTDESGASVACPADLCLKKCYEDPAHVCAAVTIERDGVGCKFYSAICTPDSAASDKEKDTYFKRLPDGEVEDYYATQSNLTTLSFEPVALTHNRGAALKVCFCDSVLHPGCRTPADFDVELGRLHVSGTACQVARPMAATHDCRVQEYSGLACVPKETVCTVNCTVDSSSTTSSTTKKTTSSAGYGYGYGYG